MPAISVSKSITINASAERVFSVIRDFKQWKEWSPWIIAEPDCSLAYADDGKSYSWDGEVIGSGGMTVAGQVENQRIDCDLQFLKPFKSQAKVTFLLDETDGATLVTWNMESSVPFFLFFMKDMMTAMIGCDYERGLLMVKTYIETGSVPSKLEFGEQTHEACTVIGVRATCSLQELGVSMRESMKKIGAWIADADCERSGVPISMYHNWDPVKGTTEYTIGFPVEKAPESLGEGIGAVDIPALRAYTVTHTGPYEFLGNAWASGMMRARAKVFKESKVCAPFEIYQNDPEDTPPEELVTVVNLPMK